VQTVGSPEDQLKAEGTGKRGGGGQAVILQMKIRMEIENETNTEGAFCANT
jgi:hypothetical protein